MMARTLPAAVASEAPGAGLTAELSAALELIGEALARRGSGRLLVPERIAFTPDSGGRGLDFVIEAGPAGLRAVPAEAAPDGR